MPKAQPLKIEQCYKLYVLDGRARLLSDSTLRTYQDRIVPFIDWCNVSQKITTLAAIKPDTVRAYFVLLDKRKLSDYTINGVGRALRAFFNFCVNENLILESPMRLVKPPKVGKRVPPSFSADDVKKLIEAVQIERDEAILLLMLDTGIRATELITLNVEDVDLKTGAVLVRQGKGKKDRTVYLGAKTRRQIYRYLIERGRPGDGEPLFVSERNDGRLSTAGLRQLLLRLGKTAKVKSVSPHKFRRTFAIMSLRNGMSIYHLQRIMGHADIDVLKVYLDLVDSDSKQAHDQFGVVDKLK